MGPGRGNAPAAVSLRSKRESGMATGGRGSPGAGSQKGDKEQRLSGHSGVISEDVETCL